MIVYKDIKLALIYKKKIGILVDILYSHNKSHFQ